ncbi:tyrosine-type recombinase/integrase [Paraburkholderia fungorum]|jgi:integrase/recombinase XerD|uniref:Tyrosine-type recombinase/integrase n=1 Tax=Paraburkholderia fungorum TaxID=134537 RepID=A0AAP5QIY8_9BURK|nr:tyrosine-type recombinase/integrase [Paraburkholderia fungorum]MDT8843109.1 tyrosine-type recombinase/integrase [Paraburkholderia fungorum]
MKLTDAIEQYLTLRKATGCGARAIAVVLHRFAKGIGPNRQMQTITRKEVRAFLDRNKSSAAYWRCEHSALRGFYGFAFGRGLAPNVPLPNTLPRLGQRFRPYVYTDTEVERLVRATDDIATDQCLLEPPTFRTLIWLLYGAGLRVSEALNLALADVDLAENLLIIRQTKFYKARMVPIGPALARIVVEYARSYGARFGSSPARHFLVSKRGLRLTHLCVNNAFVRLRRTAGISRIDGARYQPRLHDLRHAFAVKRLTTWYQQGADVQALLPLLSTYLGHANVVSTQVYLTMTPDLLVQASSRFERYVGGQLS